MGENYNPYEEDLDVIYEDDSVRLIDVMTKKGLKYLLPDFDNQDLTGVRTEFGVFSEDIYFIVGKDPESEIFMFKEYEDGTKILNVTDGFKSSEATDVRDVISKYPQLKEDINKIFKGGTTFEYLKSIMSGKVQPSWGDDVDPLIDVVNYNEDRPSSSSITIKFEEQDDFLDVFNIDNEDRYYYKDANNPYAYRDTDVYWFNQQWEDGDFVNYTLNDENKKKFDEIISLVSPKSINKETQEKVKVFDQFFSSYSEDFLTDYAQDYQNCVEDNVRESINSEFENPFMKFGIKEVNHSYKYEVNISVLLTWFKQLNVIGGTVKDLLTKLIDKYDKNNRGDWSELEYNIGCDDFDYEKLNDRVSNIFDDVMDGIQENGEFGFMNFEEYSNYLDYIQKLGGFGTVMTIPKSENKKFVISDLDRSTNKATIAIDTGEREPEYRKLSMDELNSFLYNYELFNESKLKLWKIMKEIY